MLLFKLWIFDFDIASLIAFLVGIGVGFALLGLIYATLVVSSLKSKKYVVKNQTTEVDESEIKEIISNSQKALEDKNLKGAKSTIGFCGELIVSMAKDISRKYYPKSKRPFAELSIDEILRLAVYVSNRINDLIERPGLRLLKKVKLSTILGLNDAKRVIEDSALMKVTKKYKLVKVFNKIKGALNIFNPIYWVRRSVINTSLDFATKKLCIALLGIVGEELYKIYSKRVFNEEVEIDTNVEEIANNINKELADISDDEIDEYLATQGLEKKLEKKGIKGD